MPTFAPGYNPPGFYVQQQDISTPNAVQGQRIVTIIGQGAKTLGRTEFLTKGTINGIDGPLTYNTVIEIVSIVDQDGVVYAPGVDFQISRGVGTASVDWSLKASLTATQDLSAVVGLAAALDGKMLRLVVNGGTGTPSDQYVVFTTPATPNDVVTQINSWHPSLAGVASLDGSNRLVLSQNSILIEPGNANATLGLTDWSAASVKEPATGKAYKVFYTSDKLANEYKPQVYSNMNDLIGANGALQAQTVLSSGTATAGGASSLTDGGKSWTNDEFVGSYVKITGGTGKGQVRVIISNTATALTLSQAWSTNQTPDNTSTYQITDINENSISMGAQTAVSTGATFVITSQYADDIFNQTNIKAAIDNLKQDVQGFRPYCLVLMRGLGSTEVDPINYLHAHCDEMSNVINNKWRMAVLGLARNNTNYLSFMSLASGTASDRVVLVNISEISNDFGSGEIALDGSYVAAAWAGVICANEDAGTPLLRRSIANAFLVSRFSDPFLDVEKNAMAGAGVTVFERQGNDLVCRDDLNTDMSTALSKGTKYTRAKDFVSDYLKRNLEGSTVGQRFVTNSTGQSNVIGNTKANLNFLFSALQNPLQQIVSKVENLSVSQNQTDKEQLDITADVYLTPDVKYVFALLGFGI